MSPPTLAPKASTRTSLLRDSQGKETASKSAQSQAEDSIIDAAESGYSQVINWKDQLDDFLAKPENELAISSVKNVLSAALDAKNIEEKFTALAQTSKIIMDGLDILGKIHPFIGLAAQAFKLAINADVTRRENDKKVLAVLLQMQDMIVVLFLLRRYGPRENIGDQTVETKMRVVMKSIVEHITSARSACEEYQSKGFFAKMIKCKIYEDRLAGHAQIFADDKREVQFSLQLKSMSQLDEIDKKIDQHQADLKKQIKELFRVLETEDERKVRESIKNEAQDYIGNKELQQQLFAKGEKFLTPSQLANEKKSLEKELAENVDEVFKKHIALFTSQLEKENGRLFQTMTADKKEILAAVNNGPHMTINDLDMREVWRAHGWSDPVPGKTFISSLNEYYEKKFSSQYDSEHWVLEYINPAHAELIIEAVDADGSGHVSAQELDNFTALKPNDWSLAEWTVFWAVGWYPTLAWYKKKIEVILSQSTSLSQCVHPDNLRAANTYFSSSAIRRVKLLLRSTRSPSKKILDESRLNTLTEKFREWEEKLLETELKRLSYSLDGRAKVQEVLNHKHIDHCIFPLLYLLLNHHWDTMQRAGREHSEFTTMSKSLDAIFEAVEWRIDGLKVMFRMNSLDVKEHFSHFSCGMFYSLYNPDDEHHVEINPTQGQNEQLPQKQVFDTQDLRPIIRGGTGGKGGKGGGHGGFGQASRMSLTATKNFKEITGGIGGEGGEGRSAGTEGVGGIGGVGEGNDFGARITEGWLVQPNPDVKVTDLHELDETIRGLLIADGYSTVGGLVKATDNDLREAGLTRGHINQLIATLEDVPPKK
ncbi:hypothetical protein DFH08DRAFT_944068 [Mycena albidolilacea]|uniref:EF-hand domain-containing protein n=1 Tax=Mycena albidolilacea TaxID=1033008 RepID=A0AAD7ECK3_9AGAR|nr:hypothetical protein DFH08DRAFT_944068 [Mycena albidolilacea]